MRTEAQKERRRELARRPENREHLREQARKWRAENPGRESEKSKKWYAKNQEKRKKSRKRWGSANRGKVASYTAKRKALKLCATPAWLTQVDLGEIESWYLLGTSCGLQVDHVVPLQGDTVCGLHVPWNLQLLTPFENIAKGNRLIGA